MFHAMFCFCFYIMVGSTFYKSKNQQSYMKKHSWYNKIKNPLRQSRFFQTKLHLFPRCWPSILNLKVIVKQQIHIVELKKNLLSLLLCTRPTQMCARNTYRELSLKTVRYQDKFFLFQVRI